MTGSCFDLTLHPSFSATHEGVRKILEHHEEPFSLFTNLETLQAKIAKQPVDTKFIAIVSCSVFNPQKNKNHVYAICNFRERTKDHLFIFDSNELECEISQIQQAFGNAFLKSRELKVYYPESEREYFGDANGFVFAIEDARQISKPDFKRPIAIGKSDRHVGAHQFSINQSFKYDAHKIKQAMFLELVDIDLLPPKPKKNESTEAVLSETPDLGVFEVVAADRRQSFDLFSTVCIGIGFAILAAIVAQFIPDTSNADITPIEPRGFF